MELAIALMPRVRMLNTNRERQQTSHDRYEVIAKANWSQRRAARSLGWTALAARLLSASRKICSTSP